MKFTNCKACGKAIAFVKMMSGKTMPIDPESERVVVPVSPNAETYKTVVGYRSHFATCPSADRFRNRDKKEGVKGA